MVKILCIAPTSNCRNKIDSGQVIRTAAQCYYTLIIYSITTRITCLFRDTVYSPHIVVLYTPSQWTQFLLNPLEWTAVHHRIPISKIVLGQHSPYISIVPCKTASDIGSKRQKSISTNENNWPLPQSNVKQGKFPVWNYGKSAIFR